MPSCSNKSFLPPLNFLPIPTPEPHPNAQKPSCAALQARDAAGCKGESAALQVLCSDSRRHRFFEYDAARNVYGGYYHVREPETQRLEMSLPEFVQCSQRWQARKLFLKVGWRVGGWAAPWCSSARDSKSLKVNHVVLGLDQASACWPGKYVCRQLGAFRQLSYFNTVPHCLLPLHREATHTFLACNTCAQ